MEAEDILIQTLEVFSLPVMRQGSMEEDEEYPESFFTWNVLQFFFFITAKYTINNSARWRYRGKKIGTV